MEYCTFLSTAKCIDHYTKLRVHNLEHTDDTKDIDPRLESIVDRMFQRCYDDQEFKQVVGIALETRRIDSFEKSIMQSVRFSRLILWGVLKPFDCKTFYINVDNIYNKTNL